MTQHHSHDEKGQKRRKHTWRIVLATGVAAGVLTGITLGLIGWLFIILVSITRNSQLEEQQFGLMLLSYVAMTALSGVFVAKRTGQGAKIGAFCGLFVGPIATLLMIVSIEAPRLIPALYSYIDVNASMGAYTAGWDRGFWFIGAVFVALPTSFVSGPALGALGGRLWTQTRRSPEV
jgi:hypothetical protein